MLGFEGFNSSTKMFCFPASLSFFFFLFISWLGFDVILLLRFSHSGPVSSSYKEPRQTTSCQAAEANKGQATRACSSEMRYSVTCNLQRGL